MKEKKKILPITMDENFMDDLNIIMKENGFTTKTLAVKYAVARFSRELLPNYQRERMVSKKRTVYENPMDKVEADLAKKKERAEAEHAIKMQNGMNLCKALDGEIINQEGGHTACKFALYEKVGQRVIQGARTIPIEDLHESHVASQYKGGTKAEIHELLKA